ncbi:hypothetical protein [Streptococcus pluranimalium]|uniref:hypothetical protein n=1 Tax=Streptococcus pluranimalium TaxID=82348 RepID=UPI003F6918A0
MTTNLSPKEKLAENYADKRMTELLSMTKKELAEYIASLEVEFIDLSDSVLDDDYPFMAVNGVHGNLEAVDNEAMALLKSLDTEGEYKALWQYASRDE